MTKNDNKSKNDKSKPDHQVANLQKLISELKAKVASKPKEKSLTQHLQERSHNLFKLALTDPFSNKCFGVRAPGPSEQQSYPNHFKGNTLIKANASGNFTFVYFGQPFLTAYSATPLVGPLTPYVQNPNIYYSSNVANMEAVFSSYKSVANCCRIRNAQALNSAIGFMTCAQVPMKANPPGPKQLSNLPIEPVDMLRVLNGMGIDAVTGIVPPNLEEFAQSESISIDQLVTKTLTLINVASTDNAFASINLTDTKYSATKTNLDEVIVNNDGTIDLANSGDLQVNEYSGWSCWVITGYGFTPNANVLWVEFIERMDVQHRLYGGVFGTTGLEPVPDASPESGHIAVSQALALSGKAKTCYLEAIEDPRIPTVRRGFKSGKRG